MTIVLVIPLSSSTEGNIVGAESKCLSSLRAVSTNNKFNLRCGRTPPVLNEGIIEVKRARWTSVATLPRLS